MKTSVLIIAHNEESNIQKTLSSILELKKKPDEIIVICHNCTDETRGRALEFKNIIVIEDSSPRGAIYARIRGFKEVSGDIICCLDGDSRVEENWLEEITKPFNDEKVVAVGTDVRLHGTFLDYWGSIFYFYTNRNTKRFSKKSKTVFFWGASFAVRKVSFENIGGLDPALNLFKKLNVSLMPDDWYLGIKLSEIGKIVLTKKTTVHTQSKCKNSLERFQQSKKQTKDGKKLYSYFNFKI